MCNTSGEQLAYSCVMYKYYCYFLFFVFFWLCVHGHQCKCSVTGFSVSTVGVASCDVPSFLPYLTSTPSRPSFPTTSLLLEFRGFYPVNYGDKFARTMIFLLCHVEATLVFEAAAFHLQGCLLTGSRVNLGSGECRSRFYA